MNKFYTFLLITFFSINHLKAQSNQVVNLARNITSGIKTDSLKVRAIYDWVTANIEYDVPLLRRMGRKSAEEFIELQQPAQVLESKKAVCMGYSILFKELCKASGISAEFISGYSKSVDYQTKRPVIPETLHAWNAVKINGVWYLCDLTWSAGSVDEQKGMFFKQKNEKYYLSLPLEFSKTHLPFDPIWQLTNQPLTVREFKLYAELPPNRLNPPQISYQDSLKVYSLQDDKTRKINSYRRAFNFDRSNDEAKASLGYFYFGEAKKSIDSYDATLKSFLNINTKEAYKKGLDNKNTIFELLKDAENNIRWARYYYVLIPQNSKFTEVANANKNSADSFQNYINQNRAMLTKYYDFVKTQKM